MYGLDCWQYKQKMMIVVLTRARAIIATMAVRSSKVRSIVIAALTYQVDEILGSVRILLAINP